jgi:hypothetical protein
MFRASNARIGKAIALSYRRVRYGPPASPACTTHISVPVSSQVGRRLPHSLFRTGGGPKNSIIFDAANAANDALFALDLNISVLL